MQLYRKRSVMEETHIGVRDGCKWVQAEHTRRMLRPLLDGQLNDRDKASEVLMSCDRVR